MAGHPLTTDLRVTVDREPRIVPTGSSAAQIFAEASIEAIAVRANDVDLHDLSWVPGDGDHLESIPLASDEGREVLRHSTAHVLAQAVTSLFPGAKFAIGPPIENGFYYDFEVERPFTPEDLESIEARMREIVAADQRFERRVVDPDEAQRIFADQPYKLEIIERAAAGAVEGEETVDASGPEITVYENAVDGERWTDLCRGPHVPSTSRIPAFKLMRIAGAYWRGDERNKMLQRIYGTAWESQEALEAHLQFLAEAEARDHRRLGVELDLFSFPDEIGSGLAVFHPKGGAVRRVMEDYSRRMHEQAGYLFVNSPHISKENLFQISGHLQWFAEGMFPPMELDAGHRYYLKPMNCPFHILIYKSRGRSYRELPMRLFEFGTVYRYEKSGVVHGLTRVRGLTQDDAHIFCTKEQMAGELVSLLDFVLRLLGDYGLQDFYLELSTRDDTKEKFIGDPQDWAEATAALQAAAEQTGLSLVADPGGAAFYGPKISVQARDAIGRTWQMSTIQVDFQEPARFEMEYQSSDNTRERPIMIHRALFGSIERFFGVLTEHYAGAFPPWLAPVQVACIPIAERHIEYLQEIATRLQARGLRVEVDDTDERMQKKIVKAQHGKVPYMLIAGDKDIEAGAVSFRYRDGTERRGVPVNEALEEIELAVENRVADAVPLDVAKNVTS